MPKVLVNAYGVTCEKCDKKVPAKYYYGIGGLQDEMWIECIHNGWYCPNHSPTSNCDDMECVCCNLNYWDEDEDNTKSEVEFDSNAVDNALYKDNLDWTFNKPKEGEYSSIYIINRKEEEDEEEDEEEISNMNMNCIECDYSLTESEFYAGKGRIMFSEGEGIEKGQYRCGKCDTRADETGHFPIEDEDEEEEDEVHCCETCGCELDEEYWKAFAFEKSTTEPNPVYCTSICDPYIDEDEDEC